MPITKSAKKALRRDHRKTKINKRIRLQLKKTVAKARKEKTPKVLAEAYRLLDRAAKKGVIHKNKANRLKSRLSKTVSPKTKEEKEKSPKKKKGK
jgi:small subunit ribosomal protein S20